MAFDLDRYIDKPVRVKEIISKLAFDPELVEDAAIQQARMALEASRFRLQCFDIRQKRQRILEHVTAQAGARLRRLSNAGKRTERKSEAAIKDEVILNKEVMQARRRYERAIVHDEFAKELVSMFRHRQTALKVVSETRNTETYNEIRHVKNRMVADDMKKQAKRARKRYEELEDDDD